jgi:hypothetical protein
MWKIMMDNKYFCRSIDIAGKLILVWFFFSTFRYFYFGRFTEELRIIPKMFSSGDILWLTYTLFQVPIAAVGIVFLIPLLLKGHIGGLILGILYWIMGNITNPLWFIFPREMQVGSNGSATAFLWGLNIAFSVVTLIILVLFYFYRRSIKLKHIIG